MAFSIATFNVRDLFDDVPPHVIGEIDRAEHTDADRARASTLYADKLATIASVVRRTDADVIAFQEVKNARVLDDLRALLPARNGQSAGGYGPAVVALPDRRGISCGLLSRFEVTASANHGAPALPLPVFVEGDAQPFPARLRTHRAVLEAAVKLGDGTECVLFVVHLKSNLPTAMEKFDGTSVPIVDHHSLAEGYARSAFTRIAEALFVRRLVDARFDRDPNTQLVVCGDFNDGESSIAVRAVMGDSVLASRSRVMPLEQPSALDRFRARALRSCARAVPLPARYSLAYRGAVETFDHILVSNALWSRFRSARFLNETLLENADGDRDAGLFALPSDHAPLVAEFV